MKTTIHTIALIYGCILSIDAREPGHEASQIPHPRHRNDKKHIEERNNSLPTNTDVRSINGSGNNLAHPEWGMAEEPMRRRFPNDYADGSSQPSGEDRSSAREISNEVVAQAHDIPNRRGATDYLWQWGQFLDHDIVETPTIDPAEPFDIIVPAGDPWFDPTNTGAVTISLNRSFYEIEDGIREQVNFITSYIDGSNVYGSDSERAIALRRLDGSGKLKTTPSVHGDLLPYNEGGYANAPTTTGDWFIAGDVRANEQAALTAMHTLFVREHNYWADTHRAMHPEASGDEIYEFARKVVGAEIQHITYTEFLPILLGPHGLPPYRGYRPDVDPTIMNEFATAAYRFGHSLLPETLLRINADGTTSDGGNLPLAEAFFDPSLIEEEGIETLLRGLASQRCQELDGMLVDGVRNFLFGPPGSGGFDLASLNIQRGRDHGLPSYNDVRRRLGMPVARRFRDVNPNRNVYELLSKVYDQVEDIDLWVGGLCEPHSKGAMVGPVFHRILSEQFLRLRDGDRFYYESRLDPKLLKAVRSTTLADIIRRNTEIGDELPNNVFIIEDNQKIISHKAGK